MHKGITIKDRSLWFDVRLGRITGLAIGFTRAYKLAQFHFHILYNVNPPDQFKHVKFGIDFGLFGLRLNKRWY